MPFTDLAVSRTCGGADGARSLQDLPAFALTHGSQSSLSPASMGARQERQQEEAGMRAAKGQ